MRLFLFLAFRGLGCLMGMENWHWRWDGGRLGWTDVWGGYTREASRSGIPFDSRISLHVMGGLSHAEMDGTVVSLL